MSLFLQNILSIFRYGLMRENRETELRSQVVEKENNLEAASKTHAETLELAEKRANDLEEKNKKEKSRADEAEQAVKILQQSLELAKTNVIKAKGIIDGLSSENDLLKAENNLLKAEVQKVTDLRNEEKAALAQKIDDTVEATIDKTLFRVWSQNPGVLNLDFLCEELEPTLARWEKKLEEEAEDTIIEATNGNDEEEGDEASSLKTARGRLAELKEVAREIFRETPPTEPETSIPPPVDEPTTKDVPSIEDGAQK